MNKPVMLNNDDHRDLKIITEFRPELGDEVMWTPTFAAEFRNIQAHYPILFHKDEATGGFVPIALLGLEANENLFLRDGRWEASYIPLMIQRVPFSIGRYCTDDPAEERRLLHVDLDHPKASRTQGQPLFEPHGANTAYLDRLSAMMETIHHWSEHNEGFIRALTDLQLLETVSIDITLDDGEQGQLMGFFAISEEKLVELEDRALVSLHRHGYLEPIYMALASTAKVKSLMERKVIRKREG